MTVFDHAHNVKAGEAPYTELTSAMDRFKEDHSMLRQILRDIQLEAGPIEKESDPKQALGKLKHLRLWISAFNEELNRHFRWEEEEFIPLLNVYVQSRNVPSIASDFRVMEKEHELANSYMMSFLRSVHQLKEESPLALMNKAASYLLMACEVFLQHLDNEEKLIRPLIIEDNR